MNSTLSGSDIKEQSVAETSTEDRLSPLTNNEKKQQNEMHIEEKGIDWSDERRTKKRWRVFLVVTNVSFAILLALGILLWYLKVIPVSIDYIQKRQCTPLLIPLCRKYKVPYDYTSLPDVDYESQGDAMESILRYDPLISVRCYDLLPMFLCTIFAPKCINQSKTVPPCRSFCKEIVRRCDFFLKVFSVTWPPEMDCDDYPESMDPDICIGPLEMEELEMKNKVCDNGFKCDESLCIPRTWICDGFFDCLDGSDESNCSNCGPDQYYCGRDTCINKTSYCDGVIHCPQGKDERQCLRLNHIEDHTKGRLEAYNLTSSKWHPICGNSWNYKMSEHACMTLGFRSVNQTKLRDNTSSAELKESALKIVSEKRNIYSFSSDKHEGCQDEEIYVYLKCQHFQCGKSALPPLIKGSYRIVGGDESEPGAWPWLVALHGGPDEVFFCGGVLISEWWVLSAAHCVGNQTDAEGWSLKLGMTRRSANAAFTYKRGVSDIVTHPAFSSLSFYGNDIVLIRLDRAVPFDTLLRPICLPRANLAASELKSCAVIGWGKAVHDDEADYQPVIHQVQVPIVDFDTCARWYISQEVTISNTMLCAGFAEGKKDACQGDSGGPLICKDNSTDHWFVAGVVSWGIKCAQPNLPGIYTNVPLYIDWIVNTTNELGYPIES